MRPSWPRCVSTAAAAAATSSRRIAATRPSPAGPRITPSTAIDGMKSMYRFIRRNVHVRPVARMCCSVAQWWRASVNVASGAALRNDQVDDPLHAGRDGGVDRGLVLLDAVRGLGGGDQEDRVGAA